MAPRTPLSRPVEYFTRPDRPSIRVAGLVVLAEAVAVVAILWWFLERMVGRFDLSPEEMADANDVIRDTLGLAFLGIVAGWVLVTILIHAFMLVWGAEEGILTTAAVVGEAELASLVLFPLTAIGFYLLLGGMPGEPEAIVDYVRRATSAGSPVLLVKSLVGAVWVALIQTQGLAESHGVSHNKAFALTIGIGLFGFLSNLV